MIGIEKGVRTAILRGSESTEPAPSTSGIVSSDISPK